MSLGRKGRLVVGFLLAGLLMGGCGGEAMPLAPPEAYRQFQADAFASHVRFLADPALGGRMTGTEGNAKAAEYVARQFESCGLKPGGDDGGWYQKFTVHKIFYKMRCPGEDCRLTFSYPQRAAASVPPELPTTREAEPLALNGALGVDFAPMAIGARGEFAGPLVFAGYGVRNRIRGYDDYEGIDLKGAVVMVMLGEPHDKAGRSKWAVFGGWTHLAAAEHKIKHAAEQGAAAVLVVTPPDIAGSHDPLYNVYGRGDGPLPAVRISLPFADRLLEAGGHETIAELAEKINTSHRAASFVVGGAVSGATNFVSGAGRNVIGILPSDVADDAPVIVVGAHHDHLDPYGELADDSGFGVRPGAHDNASGVAGLILIARAMAKTPNRRRTYVFASFDGEEIDFLGSKHFVAAPPVPLERIEAMVAIEMIGRIGRAPLIVLGNVLNSSLRPAIGAARAQEDRLGIFCLPITSKSHWSDQAPFTTAGVPTLLFSGTPTSDYHTRRDTRERINPRTGAKAARTIFEVLRAMGQAPQEQQVRYKLVG